MDTVKNSDGRIYDSIGRTFASTRMADERIVDVLCSALRLDEISLEDEILDVGAGTANYSLAIAQKGHSVVALEPSNVMLEQAQAQVSKLGLTDRVRFINSTADSIPETDKSFKRTCAILSVHHFHNVDACLAEMARVTAPGGTIAIYTADPRLKTRIWIDDYFDFLVAKTEEVYLPLDDLIGRLSPYAAGPVEVTPVLLPSDMRDLFFLSAWARPSLYLDETFRQGVSHFAKADLIPETKAQVEAAVQRLEKDLTSGAWRDVHGDQIKNMKMYDGGYRVVHFRKRDT